MKDFTENIDQITQSITEDVRTNLVNHIREFVNINQECFIIKYLEQHPNADMDKIMLVHGFKDNNYTFWVEEKE